MERLDSEFLLLGISVGAAAEWCLNSDECLRPLLMNTALQAPAVYIQSTLCIPSCRTAADLTALRNTIIQLLIQPAPSPSPPPSSFPCSTMAPPSPPPAKSKPCAHPLQTPPPSLSQPIPSPTTSSSYPNASPTSPEGKRGRPISSPSSSSAAGAAGAAASEAADADADHDLSDGAHGGGASRTGSRRKEKFGLRKACERCRQRWVLPVTIITVVWWWWRWRLQRVC